MAMAMANDNSSSAAAHFASLPTDPLAAYALGLLHMLQHKATLAYGGDSHSVAVHESDAIATRLLAFLSDPEVETSDKHALMSEIEHAMEITDVEHALSQHRLLEEEEEQGSVEHSDGVVSSTATTATTATAPENEEQEESPMTQEANTSEQDSHHVAIPAALSCAICCDELMVRPVSLPCGHSFCKRCLDVWFKCCAQCPTCRHAVACTTTVVNHALHELMAELFPGKLRELEDRDQRGREDVLRAFIQRSIETGQPIRELVAQHANELNDGEHDAQADVSHLLANDAELQGKLMAAEMREQLRQEKALREASRRRHVVAYCSTLPGGAHSHVRILHAGTSRSPPQAAPPTPPTPGVQSNRPMKKYVPPVAAKKPFFGSSLLRRLHHLSETHA